MEFFIVLLIIAVMLLVFGVPVQTLLVGAAILIVLLLILMLLFFIATAVFLLFFRRRKGHFLRFDANHRFEQAVYLVEGEEYTNLFPAESVLRKQIYKDRLRTVLILRGKRNHYAFDMHSVLILILGIAGTFASLLLFVTVLRLFV